MCIVKELKNNVCLKDIKCFILQNRKTDRQNTKIDAPKSEKVAKNLTSIINRAEKITFPNERSSRTNGHTDILNYRLLVSRLIL